MGHDQSLNFDNKQIDKKTVFYLTECVLVPHIEKESARTGLSYLQTKQKHKDSTTHIFRQWCIYIK